jgi:hypothetical protein
MTGVHEPPAHQCELAEVYVALIEAHLSRFARGHDPLGHLFGIERLARAARTEWLEAERRRERAKNGRRP